MEFLTPPELKGQEKEGGKEARKFLLMSWVMQMFTGPINCLKLTLSWGVVTVLGRFSVYDGLTLAVPVTKVSECLQTGF